MPAHMFDLTGRVAVVTGGATGLGFAMAEDIGNRVGIEPGVDGVEHGATGGHAEMGDDLSGHIREYGCNNIARRYRLSRQGRGKSR